MRRLRSVAALALAWGLVVPSAAIAQPASSAAAEAQPADDDPTLAEAKDLNRQGLAILNAGDVERALQLFQASRNVLPAAKNTANVAICLDRLGRYDEALAMYEELLTKYGEGLDEEGRAAIVPAMEALRLKVGSLDVAANVDGMLEIDGKRRGSLPLPAALRLVAGHHSVSITKQGYDDFTSDVEVGAGATTQLDAKLKPIPGLGRIRVEDASMAEVDVYVDGARVGVVPWEGVLHHGHHVVWTRRGEIGSAPTMSVLLDGQTTLLRLQSRPLGARVDIQVEPRTALLELDGVAIGKGSWSDRLPLGTYVLHVSEAGYVAHDLSVVQSASAVDRAVRVRLAVDPSHPRWPKVERGSPWIEAFGGFAGGGTLESGAEAGCPEQCRGEPAVSGYVLGARAGYRFPVGISLELSGGFLSLATSVERTEVGSFDAAGTPTPVEYALTDDLWVRGPFALGGVSYRYPVQAWLAVLARANVGVLFTASSEDLSGAASTTAGTASIAVDKPRETLHSAAPLLVPSFGAVVTAGPIDVGLHLGLGVILAGGPTFAHDRFGAYAPDPAHPAAAGNAPEEDVISDEAAYGVTLAWVPQVSVGRSF